MYIRKTTQRGGKYLFVVPKKSNTTQRGGRNLLAVSKREGSRRRQQYCLDSFRRGGTCPPCHVENTLQHGNEHGASSPCRSDLFRRDTEKCHVKKICR